MDLLDPEDNRAAAPYEDPFKRNRELGAAANVGAVEIESQRAVAEALGEITLAKRFPRSMSAATAEFLEACRSIEFASVAFYAVKNRGSGPSIRFAEECARCYSNFEYGHIELSRGEEKSEVVVYAWDKEKNNRSRRGITVEHILDTSDGPKKLKTQTDIDNRIANVAAKQMRGRIMALMPKSMVAAGIAECKKTLAGGNTDKPISERIVAMANAFNKLGVNNKMLAEYLKHPVDDTTTDEIADLQGIYNAIKDGSMKASEVFKAEEPEKVPSAAAAAIAAAAKKGNAAGKEEGDKTATPTPTPASTSTTKGAKVNKTQAAAAPAPKPAEAPPAPEQPWPDKEQGNEQQELPENPEPPTDAEPNDVF